MPSGMDLNNTETYDLWKVTLPNLQWDDKVKMYYLMGQQNYTLADKWFFKEKVQSEGGTNIKRQVIYRDGEGLTWTRPGATRTAASSDGVAEVTIPYAGAYGQYSITTAEIQRNIGLSALKKIVNVARARGVVAAIKDLDDALWGLPDTTNNLKPRGIPYHLVPITGAQVTAGTGAGAHQGTYASGFSDWQGLAVSTTVYPRARSYNGQWTNSGAEITQEDIRRIARMFRRLRFSVPGKMAGDVKTLPYRTSIYTDETVIENLGNVLARKNDNIGTNVIRWYGLGVDGNDAPILYQTPIEWAAALDTADATNRGGHPLYMINNACFYPVTEKGCELDEALAPPDRWQPDVILHYLELSFNTVCENRQIAGGVISWVAAA